MFIRTQAESHQKSGLENVEPILSVNEIGRMKGDRTYAGWQLFRAVEYTQREGRPLSITWLELS